VIAMGKTTVYSWKMSRIRFKLLLVFVLGNLTYLAADYVYEQYLSPHFNPHVEFLRYEYIEVLDLYRYWFGLAGEWNYSMIQQNDFVGELNTTLSGALIRVGTWRSSPFRAENKGFEKGVYILVTRELTSSEISEVVRIIRNYLY